ncbi:FAD-binding oxidoreductase [Mesorhizobium sp. RP14(2022)]|uniref:FAD-binding oxidoreductase n=1 Tax=Mesorhizobium liriopis TaxID=2953882 RepID=A0ABT1C6Q2_9HYPH|nr:FAD-binding oxidoreductase [Mesorhizobium liriopis]MCO6050501.1 FAD-binding oxidoreductase [Mesorhizobium liriopis]
MNASFDFLSQLATIVGERHVLTASDRIAGYLIDVRKAYEGQALCIVEPADTLEVSAVVALCSDHDVAITPIGGNTGLVGGGAVRSKKVADGNERPGIGLSLRRLDRIREISALDGTITVEAGCVLQKIQEAAAEADLYFPLSLSAEGSCQIGGNIATNAGGTAAVRYGVTRQLVLGLEVVLPSGKVIHGLKRLRKDNAGYDLKQLFIGSEGTLGIITAAVMRVMPAPKATATAMVALDSIPAALEVLRRMHAAFGERVTSAEITERAYMDLVLKQLKAARPAFPETPTWSLLLEVSDSRDGAELKEPLEETLASALEDGIASDVLIAQNEAQAESFWYLRHGVSEAIRHAGPNMSHDSSVPLERQGDYVLRTRERILERFPEATPLYVGHLGDGNMHLVVMFSPDRFIDRAAYSAVSSELDTIIDDVVVELDGSITAEHGIGLSYRSRLARTKAPAEIELMQGIKAVFDPRNIMNPGKLLPA